LNSTKRRGHDEGVKSLATGDTNEKGEGGSNVEGGGKGNEDASNTDNGKDEMENKAEVEASPDASANAARGSSTNPNSNLKNAQSSQNQQENPAPTPRRLLRFAHVAELFVNIRRAQRRAAASTHHRQRNGLLVESCSGEEWVTHTGLVGLLPRNYSVDGEDECASGNTAQGSSSFSSSPQLKLKRCARVSMTESFACVDGVDAPKLLRATRGLLHERAEGVLGSCVFVEESWTCSVYSHRHRQEVGYRVHTRYSATSASLTKDIPQSPTRAAFPSNLPPITEATEKASTPDSPPSSSPPSSPSRKGKKRFSFSSNKSESKTNSPEASGLNPVVSPSSEASAATGNSKSMQTTSPASPTLPPSPGKSRTAKSRSVSFAQPTSAQAVASDVRQPVALDRARGIPGLMTIVSRETIEFVVAPVQ